MKRWYKSKAIIGSIITAVPSIFMIVSPYLDPAMQDTLKQLYQTILPLGLSLGLVGIRTAKKEIGKEERGATPTNDNSLMG